MVFDITFWLWKKINYNNLYYRNIDTIVKTDTTLNVESNTIIINNTNNSIKLNTDTINIQTDNKVNISLNLKANGSN